MDFFDNRIKNLNEQLKKQSDEKEKNKQTQYDLQSKIDDYSKNLNELKQKNDNIIAKRNEENKIFNKLNSKHNKLKTIRKKLLKIALLFFLIILPIVLRRIYSSLY